MNRAKDWLEQAKRDLEHARKSIDLGDYEWACFAAQQAAEKAVKALHARLGQIAWGHSVLGLMEQLPSNIQVPIGLLEAAKILDNYYIPPRCPNAYPSGAPYRYYTEKEAKEAVIAAEEVIGFCERQGI